MVPDSSPSLSSPAVTPSRSHWQHRQVLLQRVRHYWIEGVLDRASAWLVQSPMPPGNMMRLALVERRDLVGYAPARTWEPAIPHPLPADTTLLAYWQHLGPGGSLLLLGAAGAGKTTLLLELGRELLDRAQADPAQPLPIILTLASWQPSQTLIEWLIAELRSRYQLSPTIGLSWLDTQDVLLLLDGLDEVPWAHRGHCVAALNEFKQRHSLVGMVVCSRQQAYLDLGEHRLEFQSAIALQPLAWEQVQTFLKQLGPAFAPVQAVVASDPTLQELLTTPLMLRLLTLAYGDEVVATRPSDRPLALLPPDAPLAEQRTHLLNAYVDRLLAQSTAPRPYSPAQLRHWLGRLAYRLTQQSQTTFALDQLQPQWLLTLEPEPDWPLGTPSTPHRAYRTYVTGVVLGSGLIGASLGGMTLGVAGAAIGGALGAAIGWHKSVTDRIEPVTQLWWSWEAASRGVVIGGLAGVSAGFATGTLGGGLLGLISGGVMGSLLGGLVPPQGSRPREVSTPDPNQGIWRSLQNAAIFGGVGALLGGVSGAGFAGFASGNVGQGLLTGSLLAGGLLALHKGGLASLKHGWLRWLLYRQGELPWNVRQFLEAGVERLCLQRVGGHYAFSHRLLQAHFAAEVVQEYSERIHLNPNDTDAYVKRAALAIALGDWDAAGQDYDRVIALQPDWPEAYAARSWVRYQQGDYPGTIADYALLLDRAPALAQRLTYKPTSASDSQLFLGETVSHGETLNGGETLLGGGRQDTTMGRRDAYPTSVLTVLNDEINSFEQVITALNQYLPGIDRDRARQLAQRIHQEGQAIVWEGPAPLVALYQIQLQQAGLTAIV